APATEFWLGTMPYTPDTDLRILALQNLLDEHSDRVIPLLREIALDGNSPDEARRAVFVLAHSQKSEARSTVVELANRGAVPVRLAAIRELGRFQDANVSSELLRVYSASTMPQIRRQVVTSLGERADRAALLSIAKAETDPNVRNPAILTLGRIPAARDQLRVLYGQLPRDSRGAVLTALFTARDEDELIRIATTEKDPLLRQRARAQLRMLATPKALKFLADNP
ncbi:MAG TPA: HEAT repeat domain-containing protein, partial [Vicinamibacterales bacterium]|nr:HEAT repeat domain-containing protein [Vicinamibacterales bacterium]